MIKLRRFTFFWGVLLITASVCSGYAQQEAGVDIRIVNEMAPPGGLAVILVELTEPKPISGGQLSLTFDGGVLGGVQAAALLDSAGDLQATVSSVTGRITAQFTSPGSTFGIAPDLPIMVLAVPVSPTAQTGQVESVILDLTQSFFRDPDNQLYPQETKSGVVTVGGVCITDMSPSGGTLAAGSKITIRGLGFEPGIDVNIENAFVSQVMFRSALELEVTAGATFTLAPETRVRLRNPSGSEEIFYPAVLAGTPSPNTPPSAVSDSLATLEDQPVTADLLENDSDPDGDVLVIQSITQPQHGTAVLVDSRQVSYAPSPDFNGMDSFMYSVIDGEGGHSTSDVTVQVQPVNDPPVASDDQARVQMDSSVRLAVLDNDSDVDGDPLVVSVVNQPRHGRVFLLPDEILLYAPSTGFHGLDSWTYSVVDTGGASSTATVEVDVSRTDQPPVARPDLGRTGSETPLEINVLDNDFDPEGLPLQLVSAGGATSGDVTVVGGHSVTYAPNPGFLGVDQFEYLVSDGNNTSGSSVTVVVHPLDLPIEFSVESLTLVAGSSEELVVILSDSVPAGEPVEITPDREGLLEVPSQVVTDQDRVGRFRVFARRPGIAILKARVGESWSEIPIRVVQGVSLAVPVLPRRTGADLGLAVTNFGAGDTRVRLRAFTSAEGLGSPRQLLEVVVDLQPGEQIARLLGEFDPALLAFDGWVEVASESPEVAVMFLNLQTGLPGFAGSSSSGAALRFMASSFDASPSQIQVALINHNSDTARVLLEWYPIGCELNVLQPPHTCSEEKVAAELEMASLESAVGTVDTLVPGLPGDSGGVLVVSSDRPLAGYYQVLTEQGLWGQNVSPFTSNPSQLLLPHYASEGNWTTEVLAANFGETEKQILFQDLNGSASAPLTVSAGEAVLTDVGSVLGFLSGEVRVGSLVLEAPAGVAVAGLVRLGGNPGIATNSPLSGAAAMDAVFSQVVNGVVQGEHFFTGLAVQNAGSEESLIRIDVYDPSGRLAGSALELLEGGARTSRLVGDMVADLGPLGRGYMRVRATHPVALVEMIGDFDLTFLSTVVPAVSR